MEGIRYWNTIMVFYPLKPLKAGVELEFMASIWKKNVQIRPSSNVELFVCRTSLRSWTYTKHGPRSMDQPCGPSPWTPLWTTPVTPNFWRWIFIRLAKLVGLLCAGLLSWWRRSKLKDRYLLFHSCYSYNTHPYCSSTYRSTRKGRKMSNSSASKKWSLRC